MSDRNMTLSSESSLSFALPCSDLSDNVETDES